MVKKYTHRGPKIVSGLEFFHGEELKGERRPPGPPGEAIVKIYLQ